MRREIRGGQAGRTEILGSLFVNTTLEIDQSQQWNLSDVCSKGQICGECEKTVHQRLSGFVEFDNIIAGQLCCSLLV